MLLWRLTTAGLLDTTFAGTGFVAVTTSANSMDLGNDVVVDGSGNILVTGRALGAVDGDLHVWRFTTAGVLDVGNFGGIAVRLVWLVTGLAPALLGVTGLILWWTRVVSPRWLRSRVPAAARRSVGTSNVGSAQRGLRSDDPAAPNERALGRDAGIPTAAK